MKELFEVNRFQVLIIVESEARRDHARQALRENGVASAAFLIASETGYDYANPRTLLAPIFVTPKGGVAQVRKFIE